ncbi:MAG: hypothetical protein LC101_09665 [Flavobacteriales bacterium]|nr:hypothetical protein [Flavobacteriales bacterium]MCZ2444026.1 hypothetical protein [Flavobacteriales bacterium]
MILHITKQTKINQIQENFSTRFPNLKLEFFIDKNKDEQLTANEQVKDPSKSIQEIRENGKDGVYDIDGLTTVAELEKNFLDIFGIYVQVFRKSGDIWLMTTTTDYLTLSEQNNLATQQSKKIIPEGPGDAADRNDLE